MVKPVRQARHPARGARHRLQPVPGQDAARASTRSSGPAGSPTIPTPRTSCSCSTGRTPSRRRTARTPPTTRTPSTTRCTAQLQALDDGPQKQAIIDKMVAHRCSRTRPGRSATSRAAAWPFQQWVHNGKPAILIRDMAQVLPRRPGAARRQAGRVEPADLVAAGAAGRRSLSCWCGSRAACCQRGAQRATAVPVGPRAAAGGRSG